MTTDENIQQLATAITKLSTAVETLSTASKQNSSAIETLSSLALSLEGRSRCAEHAIAALLDRTRRLDPAVADEMHAFLRLRFEEAMQRLSEPANASADDQVSRTANHLLNMVKRTV